MKVFGTFQNSTMKNFEQDKYEEFLPGTGILIPATDTIAEMDHESTPSFFGGATVNYKPMEKLDIFATLHVNTSQSYIINTCVIRTDILHHNS